MLNGIERAIITATVILMGVMRSRRSLNMKYLKCPVCGQFELEEGSCDICPICGWEDDNVQNADHNYAGGANSLSVNEARLEFFLLNWKDTSAEAHQCKDAYHQAIAMIYKRYDGLNYATEPDRAEQITLEFKEARKNYMDSLNRLLQNLIRR